MKKNIAMKWVRALRSGKYKQTTERLHDYEAGQDRHCCLGVLCEVVGMKPRVQQYESEVMGFAVRGYGTESGQLPSTAMRRSGVRTPTGVMGDTKLTTLNDYDRYTFEQIADVIEKNWEEL